MSAYATAADWVDAYTIAEELDDLSPGSGADFLDRFTATLTVLERFPRLYGRVPRAPRSREIRVAMLNGLTIAVFIGIGVSLVLSNVPLGMVIALTALELLVAFLQAYVFTILTCIYLNDAIHPGH